MPEENPYRESEPSRRYQSDRLSSVQAALLHVRAMSEGYAYTSRGRPEDGRAATKVYRAPPQVEELESEPQVATPTNLADLLPNGAA